jgi:hypothetical protein
MNENVVRKLAKQRARSGFQAGEEQPDSLPSSIHALVIVTAFDSLCAQKPQVG